MFNGIKNFIQKVGVKLGLIKALENVQSHKRVNVSGDYYESLAMNKAIYKGFYDKWHRLTYLNSNRETKNREMLTLGMGKMSAQKMAQIVFNENCEIEIAEENKAAREFIEETFDYNNFYREFQRYLEYMFALGGMAAKVYVTGGKVKIAYALADAFFPLSNDSENVDEALFINQFQKDDKYYTLLEWNEWEKDVYVITNELYVSEVSGELGRPTKLSSLYPDLQERTTLNNLTRPLFVYFKPNIANNIELTSPLGISIFANAYDTMKQLDYMFDFYHQEFRLGKRRIAVPAEMLKTFYDEAGQAHVFFDSEEEVFQQMNMDTQIEPKDLTVDIRADEIIASINAMLDIFAKQIGFSTGSFTFDGKSMKTATEVISENSDTYQTRNSHISIVEQGIKDLIISIIEIGWAHDIFKGEIKREEIGINFDDSIATDRNEQLNFYIKIKSAGFMPDLEIIQRLFKVSEDTAKEWIAMKNAEENERSPDLDVLKSNITMFGAEE
ncbi:phage portal protein [Bacillus sp. FSL K6-3431]|uniref:phage portal protein n=1 Tax=Bacillus sp. FSL K6-3431 TaxID=2921500 RepID=UPI0030F5A2CB